ncbi:4459_t:CDS:2, partial [Racocetra fulgida]
NASKNASFNDPLQDMRYGKDTEKVAYYQISELAKVKALFERDRFIKKE